MSEASDEAARSTEEAAKPVDAVETVAKKKASGETALANVSPLRSATAVAAGFGVNWLLAGLSGSTLATLFASEFPPPGADGETPHPTTLGLGLVTLTMALNGTVAGLLTGRLAPIASVAHAAVLAGLFGMFAMTGMDQARGLPGWFALAFALVPPAAAVFGGWLAKIGAERRARRARPRGEAGAVTTEPVP